MGHKPIIATALLGAASVMAFQSAAAASGSITLYSGRGESLVAPLIEQFEDETGITVNVRYGGTAELAVLIQEEGGASPADVYWAQDAGALGAMADSGLFAELPSDIYDDLPTIFKSETGTWVATSGRSRVLGYSPERADVFPDSVFDLTDEVYRGRVGWAPTNGSFQAFVTGMRLVHGEDETRAWLQGMAENGAVTFRNNTTQVEGIAAGEIDYAIVNNYYLGRFIADDPDFPVDQTTFESGDIGNMVNVAGAGVLTSSDDSELALEFVRFLLAEPAQEYFTTEVNEYPVVSSVSVNPTLESFDTLLEISPILDLDALEDLEGTLNLMRDVGLL